MRVILTLIIPVYNVEAYIEECLESLFPQIANSKNNDVEVIIVNDGTPDKSMDIVIHAIKKYSLERQVRVVNQCNQGLSAARNTGIRLATGDYIGFIDSDDYVSENYIREIKSNILKYYQLDILKFNFHFFRNKVSRSRRTNLINTVRYSGTEYIKNDIKENSWYAWRRIYASHLFDDILFDVGKKYEDVLTVPLLTFKSSNCVALNSTLVFYRSNPYGITKNSELEHAIDILSRVNDHVEIMKRRGYNKQLISLHVYNIAKTLVNTVATAWKGKFDIFFIHSNFTTIYPHLNVFRTVYVYVYYFKAVLKYLLSQVKRKIL